MGTLHCLPTCYYWTQGGEQLTAGRGNQDWGLELMVMWWWVGGTRKVLIFINGGWWWYLYKQRRSPPQDIELSVTTYKYGLIGHNHHWNYQHSLHSHTSDIRHRKLLINSNFIWKHKTFLDLEKYSKRLSCVFFLNKSQIEEKRREGAKEVDAS